MDFSPYYFHRHGLKTPLQIYYIYVIYRVSFESHVQSITIVSSVTNSVPVLSEKS